MSDASSASRLGTNRHTFGAETSQTREPAAGNVFAVGGGFIPTLLVGGGVGGLLPSNHDPEAAE